MNIFKILFSYICYIINIIWLMFNKFYFYLRIPIIMGPNNGVSWQFSWHFGLTQKKRDPYQLKSLQNFISCSHFNYYINYNENQMFISKEKKK